MLIAFSFPFIYVCRIYSLLFIVNFVNLFTKLTIVTCISIQSLDLSIFSYINSSHALHFTIITYSLLTNAYVLRSSIFLLFTYNFAIVTHLMHEIALAVSLLPRYHRPSNIEQYRYPRKEATHTFRYRPIPLIWPLLPWSPRQERR